MATRTRNPRAAKRNAPRPELNSRDLLLAGVGAVSLGRKQAIRSIEEAGQGVAALRKRVGASVKSIPATARKLRNKAEGDATRLRRQAEGKVAKLRKQAQGKVAQLRKQAQGTVAQLRKQASAQVAPLQRRLDVLVVEVANQAQNRFGPVIAKLAAKPAARRAAKRSTAPARRAKKATRKAA
jgi:hypothetical protein